MNFHFHLNLNLNFKLTFWQHFKGFNYNSNKNKNNFWANLKANTRLSNTHTYTDTDIYTHTYTLTHSHRHKNNQKWHINKHNDESRQLSVSFGNCESAIWLASVSAFPFPSPFPSFFPTLSSLGPWRQYVSVFCYLFTFPSSSLLSLWLLRCVCLFKMLKSCLLDSMVC